MKISEVKTAFKIADVEFVEGSTRLNFNYLKDLKDEKGNPLPQSILTQNVARVYLIVVNGEIKRLGEVKPMVALKILYPFIVMAGQRDDRVLEVLGYGIFCIILS